MTRNLLLYCTSFACILGKNSRYRPSGAAIGVTKKSLHLERDGYKSFKNNVINNVKLTRNETHVRNVEHQLKAQGNSLLLKVSLHGNSRRTSRLECGV